jgi:hypothetical protein
MESIQSAMPLVYTGANLLGSYQQSKMAEDVAKKSEQSYDKYLNTINPPKDVLDARFAQSKDFITGSAPVARRRLDDRLASRGIRGRGAVSPVSDQEQAIQDQLNNAYFQTYTNYNVPNQAPPVVPTPSTGQLFGTNVAQGANYMLPLWWMNQQQPNQQQPNQQQPNQQQNPWNVPSTNYLPY